MNSAAGVMDLMQVLTSETMTLIGLPSQKSARQQLSGTIDDVVKAVAVLVERMISSATERRTAEEFRAAVQESFPVYFRAIVSLSVLLQATVSRQAMESLVSESLSELEADFRDHAMAAFGADMRDQAIFTIWTLRKINDLANIIVAAGKVAEVHKKQDAEFADHYLQHALRARFHIDCLTSSMHTKKAIYPDILGEISDGLRSAVDAYAWIRQAVNLYAPQVEPDLPSLEPDDEDKELLHESMYDMAHETL